MGLLVTILTVFLVVLSILILLLILLQSDKSSGMGILGGGGSQSAFGSSTADVLTKATGFFVGLFLVISLGLSIIEARRPKSVVDTLPDDKKPSSLSTQPDKTKSDKAPDNSPKKENTTPKKN